MLYSSVLALLMAAVLPSLVTAATPKANLIQKNLLKTIDLTSHGSAIMRESIAVSLQTVPDEKSVKEYFFGVELDTVKNVAWMQVTERVKEDGENVDKKCEVIKDDVDVKNNLQYYKVALSEPITPSTKSIIDIFIIYKDAVSPYPKEIGQSDKQLVKYQGNLCFKSPYKTEKYKVTVKLPTANKPVSYSQKPASPSHSGSALVYGPFSESLEPFSVIDFYVHYENPKMGLTVKKWERDIFVSHWGGRVEVEENVWVRHEGAKLKGLFNRKEYQHMSYQHPETPVISRLTLEFPYSATNFYYRDEIGNVSTSQFGRDPVRKSSVLSFAPRYPLYGGWNYNWYHGYNLPIQEYVQYVDDVRLAKELGSNFWYVVTVPFAQGFPGTVIDEHEFRVVLPEGATNVQVRAPFEVDSVSHGRYYYYLDTTGRPSVTIRKVNVIDDHNKDIQIFYQYSSIKAFQKPVAVITFFLITFLLSMAYVRFDLTITENPEREKKELLRTHLTTIANLHGSQLNLYKQFDEAFSSFKSDKNKSAFESARSKIEGALKENEKKMSTLASKITASNTAASTAVSELLKLHTDRKDNVKNIVDTILNLVKDEEGKLSKEKRTQMTTDVQKLESAVQDLDDKMASVLKGLGKYVN
ncbi:Ribophorin I-domain-containing protein [Paraphysoderma sedebokerense]|nr:Ribophorin I-domain-containing protein [Paraphysoderma sedebokerense]